MADILGMMGYIQQQGEAGRQRGQQSRLASLAQQSMQAPRDQRQGLIAQMAGVDPQAAYNAESHFKGMDDSARARLGEYATAFDALPDDQKAQAYPQLAQQAQALGIPAPGQWDPAFAPNIQKLAQALGGGASGAPAGLQEFQYMAQGLSPEDLTKARRVNLGLEGRASNAGFQTIEVENEQGGKDRYTFDPRRNVYTRFAEGAPQVPAQGQPAAGEVPFSVDPNLPEAVQAAIRSDRQKFDSVPNGGTIRVPGVVPAGPRPGVGMSAADKALAAERGQQQAQIEALGLRGEIEAANEAKKAAAKGAAETQVDRTKAAIAKAPQYQNVVRGLSRIDSALAALEGGKFADTGPMDKLYQQYTPEGQELEAAIGAIQNDMLALTRVPGVGSQSDLEAKIANMKYPSLGNAPEVNRRNLLQLREFMRDLGESQGQSVQRATGGQDSAAPRQRLKFNPATGRIE